MIRKHGLTVKQALAERAARKEKRRRKARLIFSGKPQKRARKAIVKELDAIVSHRIRERDMHIFGGCPFCIAEGKSGPIEHNSHLITRSKYAVRWNLINCHGSCAGHNFMHEHNPHIYTAWFIGRYGLAKYNELLAESNQLRRFSNADLLAMIQHHKTNSLIPSGETSTQKESA